MKKIEVCLINPPQRNSLDDKLDAPLGLLYVASSIRKMDIMVRIADLSSEPYQKWEELIGYADIYGIGIYTCSYYYSKTHSCRAEECSLEDIILNACPEEDSKDMYCCKKGSAEKEDEENDDGEEE